MNENTKKTIAIISSIGILSFFYIIPLFIAVFSVLGLFDGDGSDNNSSNSDFSYIHSNYSYCDAVNLEGQLLSLEEYIAGVLQGEAPLYEDDDALKAQAIASRTYVLYKTNGCKKVAKNGQGYQVYKEPSDKAKKIANETVGMVLAYDNDLFESNFDAFCYEDEDCPDSKKNADGTYNVTYTKRPANEKHIITLSDPKYYSSVESEQIKGYGHGLGMSQYVSYQLANEGKTYEEILKYFYSSGVEIVNLNSLPSNSSPGIETGENGIGYTSTYTNSKTGKTYFNYKQCGFNNDWICDVGCGLTSTSILISSVNQKITPTYLYKNYREPLGYVSMSTYLKNYLPSNGYSTETRTVKKMKEELINHFNSGGTAIFFISKANKCNIINGDTWTNRQHYFAVLDYNSSDNTVYISNPSSRRNQSGWVSLDAFDCAKVTHLVY